MLRPKWMTIVFFSPVLFLGLPSRVDAGIIGMDTFKKTRNGKVVDGSEALLLHRGIQAGDDLEFQYKAFHIFWLPLWTYDGEFCAGKGTDIPLGRDPKQVAKITGI